MDDRLESMYERFTWRILSNYVSPWEFEQLRQEITDYEQWCGAWSAQARTHIDRGDAALAAGRRLTAGDAYLRAGLLYHWASFLFSHDKDQYRAALQATAAVWQQAAPLLDPPMSILEVPFENLTLPGYLRIPSGVTRPPVVIMFPGGDSVKEELYNLGDYIVARGLAFAAFDGPGQGIVSLDAPLRPDYELVIRAVIDSLAGRATAPLLQVYGGLDTGSPEHGQRIAAEYGGPVTNVVFDDGVHILNNIYYKARPLVADWLAETLTGRTR